MLDYIITDQLILDELNRIWPLAFPTLRPPTLLITHKNSKYRYRATACQQTHEITFNYLETCSKAELLSTIVHEISHFGRGCSGIRPNGRHFHHGPEFSKFFVDLIKAAYGVCLLHGTSSKTGAAGTRALETLMTETNA